MFLKHLCPRAGMSSMSREILPGGWRFSERKACRYLTFRIAKGTIFADKNIWCSTLLFQKRIDKGVRKILIQAMRMTKFVSRTHILHNRQ